MLCEHGAWVNVDWAHCAMMIQIHFVNTVSGVAHSWGVYLGLCGLGVEEGV